ncbi:MAG: PEGA domain-containing protein [Deltaproteobacteria bacterium]|nr:PEGA domain-containing protein [Deltaproteobacteria bacterium]
MIAFAALSARDAGAAPCPPKQGAIYDVKIDSSPQGAQIYIGDKSCGLVGTTPWTGKLPAGDFPVILETTGYDQAMRTLKVAKIRKQQELFVPMTRRPQIEIRADADPNLVNAIVSIDGEVRGPITGPLVLQTTVGRHQIEIKKDGFETLTQWIDLTTNPSVIITPQLKAIAKAKYGTVVVEADVQDAEVYIDGNKHPDNTPAVISNVIEGVHVVEVRKEPAPPWRQTVTVTADKQTKVRAEIQPLLNGGVGVVRVLSDTPGARAYIDGTDMGPVPVDIKDVKAGDHIVQVKAQGFQTGERKVQVSAGGSQIVKVDLNAEAPGDQGTLKVVSSTPGADVFIDGAAVGKVPVEKKIAAGEHPVVVRHPGFKDFEQKVRVEIGQAITVDAQLKAVGRLRILSTPSVANVIVNGIPIGKTPLDTEVEVGETVVRLELAGFQPFEQTMTIEGGKVATISRELAIAGKSEAELAAEQKGLSSFGARTLPRGRSTVDFDAGYPYFLNARITVGAGKIAKQFGFDATVGVRTFLARSELGLGGRMMLVDAPPFSAAVFSNLWFGSKLLDDSQRNGVTFDGGLIASLTALSNVTISGRAYFELWSDRHCPIFKEGTRTFEGQDPIAICTQMLNGTVDQDTKDRVEKLTGNKGNDFFGREQGARLLLSVIAEIAVDQRWSVFGILEGAPFQNERALFTQHFSGTMFDTDFVLYGRFGLTYKF